mmetsp:Transcript_8751/g.12146  ORF Transcript_8751/g.12146 Transcript_8751/m.12146 type:complete len:238 (-) Transcript_8751:201-914(-)
MGCGATKSNTPKVEGKIPTGVDSQILQIFDYEAKRTEEIKGDKEFIKKVLAAQKKAYASGDKSDLEKFKNDEKERKIISNAIALETLWKKFDIDGNEKIDHEELLELLKVYLQTAVYWLKKTIVEQAVNRLRAELAESGSNMTDSQRDHVITVLNKHATNVLQEWSDSKGSPETVGKMFQTMDENNDGVIEKKEFLKHFMDSLENDVCCSSKSRVIAKNVAKASKREITWIFKSNAV